jgi:hypothetical protein
MKSLRVLSATILLSVIFISLCLGMSMIAKSMFYLNGATNKTGEASYWKIYLGQPECSLDRKYPGEPMKKITVGINLNFLSTGYISGGGFSDKGKIDCSPVMKIKVDTVLRELSIDSINCIYDFGRKVRTTAGVIGDFIIDIEGNRITADQFTLTEYKTPSDTTDKELSRNGDDIPLSACAFTKEGIAWAIKTMAGEAKADSLKGTAH